MIITRTLDESGCLQIYGKLLKNQWLWTLDLDWRKEISRKRPRVHSKYEYKSNHGERPHDFSGCDGRGEGM